MRVRPRNPVKCTDLSRDGHYRIMNLIRNSLDMQGVISRTIVINIIIIIINIILHHHHTPLSSISSSSSSYFIIIMLHHHHYDNHDDSGHDCMLVGPTSLQTIEPSTTTWCCLQGRRIQLKFSPAQHIQGSLDLESGLMDLLKIMITSSLTILTSILCIVQRKSFYRKFCYHI